MSVLTRWGALLALMNSLLVAPVTAQSVTRTDVVEVSAQELDEIREELRYLRTRDAERQAWESSIMSRLPETKFEFAGHRQTSEAGCGAQNLPPVGCTSSGCDGQGSCCDPCCCSCCGCYLCQCPIAEAPCSECPRVSTLNPYFNVNIFGALKLDMLFNTKRPIASGTPFFLPPDSAAGFDQNTFDMHARQSTMGAAVTGPTIGEFQSGGMLIALFYNDAIIVDRYGLLPLQAYGELVSPDWRFAAGLQFDVFAPGIPTVLPFSALGASGNAGNSFRGQVRLEHFRNPSPDVQWVSQLAISEPITTTIDPVFGLSEDNGWPNVEGRIALLMGSVQGTGLNAKRPFEVGVSGVVGQLRNTAPDVGRVVADVWGLSSDFRWQVNEVFGLMGEFYTGQALGTYNGGILQSVNRNTFQAIRSSGGWMETFLYWTPCLHSHIGYGIDDPIDRDVATVTQITDRIRNTTAYGNVIWDLNQTFRVAFEFTWRETDYATRRVLDNEGAGFHTQFQWTF